MAVDPARVQQITDDFNKVLTDITMLIPQQYQAEAKFALTLLKVAESAVTTILADMQASA